MHQADPMLRMRSTDSPLHQSSASHHHHQHHHQPSSSPLLPPAPYTQPPITSSLATATQGDGWAILPKSASNNAAIPTSVASSDASSSSAVTLAAPTTTSPAQQPTAPTELVRLSQAAHAHAANDVSNRRCGPAELASSYDVPFGERTSPAIISLSQRSARSLSRNGARPPSPLALSPAMAAETLNPSGAHRGGLRGSDEDADMADKDVAMNGAEDSRATAGATPLVPPATRKLCVRHQRMADEGTTARLQKVSLQFGSSHFLFRLGSPPSAFRDFLPSPFGSLEVPVKDMASDGRGQCRSGSFGSSFCFARALDAV